MPHKTASDKLMTRRSTRHGLYLDVRKLGRLDGRLGPVRAAKAIMVDLAREHCAGEPTPGEELLLERIAEKVVVLRSFAIRLLVKGEDPTADQWKRYHALDNGLTKQLQMLGLKRRRKEPRTLLEIEAEVSDE